MSSSARTKPIVRLTALFLGTAALLAAGAAQATEIRHWQRQPIAIELPVGAERIVVFGADVRVGLPPELADPETLRVQSTNGAVYLQASEAFDTQRVQVQNVQTGQIILFDLTAKPKASAETVQVVVEAPADQLGAADPSSAPSASAPSRVPPAAFGRSARSAPTPVRLVRHAAQALYAPTRLIAGDPDVQRVAVGAPRALTGLLPAFPVVARPLAAWKAGAYTVTAIEITNRDPRRTFTLDPRGLAGDFYAASFMQTTVGPAGTLEDTTTLFAVTENGDLAGALTPPAGDLAGEREGGDAD